MARAPASQDIEAPPEIDRLGEFPHPRDTATLYGHASAETELAAGIASGRMHHAWLLAGPSGIGKATLAYRAAINALAAPFERDPFGGTLAIDPATGAARQVRAQSHPGLLVVRRNYNLKDKRFPTQISVDEVRRLRAFLGHRAGEGACPETAANGPGSDEAAAGCRSACRRAAATGPRPVAGSPPR